MGCTSSLAFSKISNEHKIAKVKGYNPEIKVTHATESTLSISGDVTKLVKDTWNRIMCDIQGNGLQVFLRIFETCPQTKKLFQVDNVRLSELARNVTIKGHATRFMQAIGAAIDNFDGVDSEDSQLSKLLILLGRQHKHYEGFKLEYFEVFYDALMWQWERYLGSEFTHEVADTWSRLFVYFMEKLKEGYRQPE